jgi:5-formyltetrahydrofolate cyclo-ligase
MSRSRPQAVPGGSGEEASLAERKRALRRTAKARRAEAAAAAPEAGRALARHLQVRVVPAPGAPLAGYWPMGDEIDPVPALEAFYEAGHPIGLPVMPGPAQPLRFRAWRPGDALVDGGFGTRVPAPGAAEIVPRLLLVPLLAFDRAGYRLGYGGGFYDRTLAALRARDRGVLAVGVGYRAQEVDAVPRDANDQRLDLIVTEAGAVDSDGDGETG